MRTVTSGAHSWADRPRGTDLPRNPPGGKNCRRAKESIAESANAPNQADHLEPIQSRPSLEVTLPAQTPVRDQHIACTRTGQPVPSTAAPQRAAAGIARTCATQSSWPAHCSNPAACCVYAEGPNHDCCRRGAGPGAHARVGVRGSRDWRCARPIPHGRHSRRGRPPETVLATHHGGARWSASTFSRR